jgi:hypothetical protein
LLGLRTAAGAARSTARKDVSEIADDRAPA